MINVGENNISVYAGDSEVSVYIGSELIYPLNFGELTGISIDNLTWVTDISWEGGTGTSANCSYVITGYYDSGKTRKLNNKTTVEGSITADSTTSETRDLVGTLVLTATCSGFTATGSVDAYQEAYAPGPANNEIWYTTTDGQIVTPNNITPTANTYTNGKGIMSFSTDITSIVYEMFLEKSTLLTIMLPSSCTRVQGFGFRKANNLTSITGTEQITTLDSYGFNYANGVKELNLPNVTTVNQSNILFCSNLESLVLTSVTGINYGDNWQYCQKLTSVTFGDTVPTTIGGTPRFWSIPSNGTLYVPTAKISDYQAWQSGGYWHSGWSIVGY